MFIINNNSNAKKKKCKIIGGIIVKDKKIEKTKKDKTVKDKKIINL